MFKIFSRIFNSRRNRPIGHRRVADRKAATHFQYLKKIGYLLHLSSEKMAGNKFI